MSGNMTERVEMTVTMQVTVAQALALEAMFNYWSYLGNIGSSRSVGFMVDGDGNFKPKCKISFDKEIPSLTDTLAEFAIISDDNGDRIYDFDPIAWRLDYPHHFDENGNLKYDENGNLKNKDANNGSY